MSIRGYKVFKEDWTCRGFQYEVGKTYKHEGKIEVCEEGFHFCKELIDCFSYYKFDLDNKVAEVEALGLVKTEGDKSVTDEIKIIREFNWLEVLNMLNQGKGNTGIGNNGSCNVGNENSGNRNSGSCNIGNRNSGSCNIGNKNAGDLNSGDCNSGSLNIGLGNTGLGNAGNGNSGHCNFGNRNTGDWNNGDDNTGAFNTVTPKIYLFNKPTEWTVDDWRKSKARYLLNFNGSLTKWIKKEDMTDEEKEENPDYKSLGGYLKVFSYEEMCENMWNSLTDEEKEVIKKLPNFDEDVFEEITGIKL